MTAHHPLARGVCVKNDKDLSSICSQTGAGFRKTMVPGPLSLAKRLDTITALPIWWVSAAYSSKTDENRDSFRNKSCGLRPRPASAAPGHDGREIGHREHPDLWLSGAFRTPQVFSGEGLHFFVTEIVE